MRFPSGLDGYIPSSVSVAVGLAPVQHLQEPLVKPDFLKDNSSCLLMRNRTRFNRSHSILFFHLKASFNKDKTFLDSKFRSGIVVGMSKEPKKISNGLIIEHIKIVEKAIKNLNCFKKDFDEGKVPDVSLIDESIQLLSELRGWVIAFQRSLEKQEKL